MQNYHSNDPYEREPLDSRDYHNSSPLHRPTPPAHGYTDPSSPYHDASPSLPPQYQPEPSTYGHHQNTDYNQPQAPYVGSQRGYGGNAAYQESYAERSPVPPRHGDNQYYSSGNAGPSRRHDYGPPAAATGAMSGPVYHEGDRDHGLEPMRGPDPGYHDGVHGHGQLPPPPSRTHQNNDPYSQPGSGAYAYDPHGYGQGTVGRDSYSNLAAIGASRAGSRSPSQFGSEYDNPFGTPRGTNLMLGEVNPHEIADDGDDGLHYHRPSNRTSMLSSHHSDRAARRGAGAGAGAAAGALGASAATGALMSGGNRDSSYNLGDVREKAKPKSKKWKWVGIAVVAFVIIGAIVGGIVGWLVANGGGGDDGDKGGGHEGQSAADDEAANGVLDKSSSEIKALLNNPDLHKVFPGMDYTPINTQYPYCIHDPPSQNNITRDVAVLSQLTNTIRLYGTDCNQTEMVVEAINKLGLEDDVKVWLGVWQDGNETTNARQLEQMWDILDNYGSKPFKGVIVANEILFREEMTITQLATVLDGVRTNLTKKGIKDFPVATSDLGDDWTQELADDSDYIMANIHPFFAGVEAEEAADWTMKFWKQRDGQYWKKDSEKNIIAEVGWPTGGGTSCGAAKTCTKGSVAGIDGLNQLLKDWVCPALEDKTQYFWFSSFDEPWKERFNEAGKRWEDKWGLMDVNRNLKDGVKIPDCGGKTV